MSSHARPDGVDDDTVEGLGKLSEALEAIEHARGLLYGFHRLTGEADFKASEAADLLEEAGHQDLAARIRRELVGRNVLEGRWTFQIVEEYDDGYYAVFREIEADSREELVKGRRHLYESDLKDHRRTRGRRHHERRPAEGA